MGERCDAFHGKVPTSVCAFVKADAYISMAVWEIYCAELMGPCGTDSRLHLHCGREQSL